MSAPEFPRRVSVAEVVHNARCELYEAVADNIRDHPWLERWAAVFDFTFTVDRDVNASADTTYLIPVQYGGFTLGINAALRQSATGTYTLGFSIAGGLGLFHAEDCDRLRAAGSTPHRLLNGEIGLRRWLDEAIPEMEDAWLATPFNGEPDWYKKRREYAGKAKKLGYTIEFGVTAEGSLLPSWSLTFPNGRQFKPALDFSASRVVTHELIVGLTPIAPEPPADLSEIRATIDGKQVIIGRRVCMMNDDPQAQCWEGDEKLKAQIDAAKKKKDLASKAEQQSKQTVLTLQNHQPAELKSKPLNNLLIMSEKQIDDVPGVSNSTALYEALEDYKQKKEAASEAAAQLKEVQSVDQVVVEHRETQRAARVQARQASEYETERRLQQIVEDQIIRGAFRR